MKLLSPPAQSERSISKYNSFLLSSLSLSIPPIKTLKTFLYNYQMDPLALLIKVWMFMVWWYCYLVPEWLIVSPKNPWRIKIFHGFKPITKKVLTLLYWYNYNIMILKSMYSLEHIQIVNKKNIPYRISLCSFRNNEEEIDIIGKYVDFDDIC
jgi:hypothetical protein